MTDTRWQRAKDIFIAAAALPAADRAAHLDKECADDVGLRAEVESLLAAAPAAQVHTGGAAQVLAGVSTVSMVAAPITEQPGARIGPYKLLERIGEGGFGTVFLAEQTQPIRRRVALKIIKLGMDTRQVVARFEAERQALALMDHPHIARVLDCGATETGRPYFVMEYVTGDVITRFAAAHRLSVRDRLTLFTQVCEAVQHAHTKGIIHRDLKPGNVLVTLTDGRPFAKVIDFGIAKATGAAGGTLTDKTLFTGHRQLIGTPEYMSPEQAEGSADLDTRTDVYALGVLLYELLTGATPFDATRLRSAAWQEMQRILREEEPPTPSLRLQRVLSTPAPAVHAPAQAPPALADLDPQVAATSASSSGTPVPPARVEDLRGELDWIIMKALEKDRARRYETPNALAADLDRHLRGEAIVAAPPSTAYRMRKLLLRHRVKVAAITTVAAALVLGLAVALYGLTEARDSAKRERIRAESEQQARAEAQVKSEHAIAAIQELSEVLALDPPLTPNSGVAPTADGPLVGMEVEALGQHAVRLARDLTQARDDLQLQQAAAITAQERADNHMYASCIVGASFAQQSGQWAAARRFLDQAPPELREWEWAHLDRLLDNSEAAAQVFTGGMGDGEGPVFGAAFSWEQKLVAIWGDAPTIQFLDLETWEVRGEIPREDSLGPITAVNTVCFVNSGRQVVLATWNAFDVWNVNGSELEQSFVHQFNPQYSNYSPVVAATSGLVAVHDTPREGFIQVRVWQPSTASFSELPPQASDARAERPLAFSQDGSLLCLASTYENPRIWDLANGTLRELSGDTVLKNVNEYAVFSPCLGRLLLGFRGVGEHGVRLFDCESGAQLVEATVDYSRWGWNPNLHARPAWPQHAMWAAIGGDQGVTLVSMTGKISRLTGMSGSIASVAFDEPASRLLAGDSNGGIFVWHTALGVREATLTGARVGVAGLTISPDGCTVLAVSRDGWLRRWSATSWSTGKTLVGTTAVAGLDDEGNLAPGAQRREGEAAIATGHWRNVEDPADRGLRYAMHRALSMPWYGHGELTEVFSGRTGFSAAIGRNRSVIVRDARGEIVSRLPDGTVPDRASRGTLALTAGGDLVAVAWGPQVSVFDALTGDLLRRWTACDVQVDPIAGENPSADHCSVSVTFNPSSGDLYTADGRQVRRWCARSAELLARADCDGYHMIVHPTGSSLVLAAQAVIVMNATTLEVEQRFASSEWMAAVALSASGRRVAKLSADWLVEVEIWDRAGGLLLRSALESAGWLWSHPSDAGLAFPETGGLVVSNGSQLAFYGTSEELAAIQTGDIPEWAE